MDKLKGGDADNYTPQMIADLHGVPLEFVENQIKMGMEEEKEHTSDPELQKEIVMDHLVKTVGYYTKLAKVEDESLVKEDGEGAPAAAPASPDSIPGMGAPQLAQRGAAGSGDVTLGISKPKKSKRVQSFDEFLKKLKKEE